MSELRVLRDEAIDRVEDNAREEWISAARDVVMDLATKQRGFTTDEVWEGLDRRGIEPPHEPRALGAVMRWASRDAKIIGRTGRYILSQRPRCHLRPIPIWESKVYRR